MKATVKKKTYNLDGEMIAKVRRLLNAKTDTEAIQRALRKAIEDREIEEQVNQMKQEMGDEKYIKFEQELKDIGSLLD